MSYTDYGMTQAIGGAVWHGIKGFRNSPAGERRIGALTAVKARAPVLGGNFGVWGGLFSTFDCAVKGYRKKEDPYNASMCFIEEFYVFLWNIRLRVANDCVFIVIAGFFTGGALAVRGGLKAARNSAIGCACLLAVIEGVGIGFNRMMAENTRLDVSTMRLPVPFRPAKCRLQIPPPPPPPSAAIEGASTPMLA